MSSKPGSLRHLKRTLGQQQTFTLKATNTTAGVPDASVPLTRKAQIEIRADSCILSACRYLRQGFLTLFASLLTVPQICSYAWMCVYTYNIYIYTHTYLETSSCVYIYMCVSKRLCMGPYLYIFITYTIKYIYIRIFIMSMCDSPVPHGRLEQTLVASLALQKLMVSMISSMTPLTTRIRQVNCVCNSSINRQNT